MSIPRRQNGGRERDGETLIVHNNDGPRLDSLKLSVHGIMQYVQDMQGPACKITHPEKVSSGAQDFWEGVRGKIGSIVLLGPLWQLARAAGWHLLPKRPSQANAADFAFIDMYAALTLVRRKTAQDVQRFHLDF